jgi:microcystin-dependent protein
MTSTKLWKALVVPLAAAVGFAAAAIWVKRAGADGIPAAPTLYYSGILADKGQLLGGPNTITVSLWTAESGGQPVCQGPTESVVLDAGRFRVSLPDACVEQVRGNPNLWVQTSVGTPPTTFARKKLGAVPYAVEAERAQKVSGPAAAQLVPSGAVMAFDLPGCPVGWAPFDKAAGRTVIGVSTGANNLSVRKLGDVLGEEAHALTTEETAAHSHAGVTAGGNPMPHVTVFQVGMESRPTHETGWAGGANNGGPTDANYSLAAHTHNFTTDDGTGGGRPHNNMQPSVVLLYCRKM